MKETTSRIIEIMRSTHICRPYIEKVEACDNPFVLVLWVTYLLSGQARRMHSYRFQARYALICSNFDFEAQVMASINTNLAVIAASIA